MKDLKELIAESLNKVNDINVRVEKYVKTLDDLLDEFGESLKDFKKQTADLRKRGLSSVEKELVYVTLRKYSDELVSSTRQKLIDEYKEFESSLSKENPIDEAVLFKLPAHWDQIECRARYVVPKDNEETVDQYISRLKQGIHKTLAFVLDKK